MYIHERVECRKHRLYIVRGRGKFTIDTLDLGADLVNFGNGGMLIRSLEQTDGARELLHRLEGENFLWTGGISSEGFQRAEIWPRLRPCGRSAQRRRKNC